MSPLLILLLAAAFGFYMAWNIGANDVANAMGTSVGARSLSFKQAIIVAAIFEFSGAILVGNHVSLTVAKGIVSPFSYRYDAMVFAYGMLATLLSAALWVNMATKLGMPVSTTHSIVGGVMGFGIVTQGFGSIEWGKVITIVLSWIVSPISGGIISFFIFLFISKKILSNEKPVIAAKRYAPFLAFMVSMVLVFSMLYKGLKNLHLNFSFVNSLLIATAVSIVFYGIIYKIVSGIPVDTTLPYKRRYPQVERIFAILQVITASYMAFSHGANDVANAVGPLMGAVYAKALTAHQHLSMPIWVLSVGAVGIVAGLSMYGYKVILVVGRRITDMTPSRGFAAEFGAATTVLVCSKMGLPISTTHTLVGSVIGVGLARGIGALNLKVLKDIIVSWLLTLPIAAALSAAIFLVLKGLFLS
ncbi:inorganic phosphate transporter [Hippea maritima]|uniref:Phosphate transporter n=1 Tax=Hippea maritima (strain ATCC 700847 / DSM 10411 / MH2) TaxID=760142 RepID=F2LVT3_HIPMA|nr:inorganic phosphate transporter [Hippea maritima]AEA33867.1 phosphate transporter [Hippea maritima DSM 10411]